MPAVYGGDGMAKESALGSCGLAASATALARVIGTHAVWGMGGRMNGRRDGSTPGCRSTATSRADGVDWAFIINTRVGIADTTWNGFVDQINASLDTWPATPLRRSRTRERRAGERRGSDDLQSTCPRISPGGNWDVWTLTYAPPLRIASRRALRGCPQSHSTSDAAVISP